MNDFGMFMQGSRHALAQSNFSTDLFFLLLGVSLVLAAFMMHRGQKTHLKRKKSPFEPVRMQHVSHAIMQWMEIPQEAREVLRKRLGRSQIRNILPLFSLREDGMWEYLLEPEELGNRDRSMLMAVRTDLMSMFEKNSSSGFSSGEEAHFEAIPLNLPEGVSRENFFPWKSMGTLFLVTSSKYVLEVHGMPDTDWTKQMGWILAQKGIRQDVLLSKLLRTRRSWFLFLEKSDHQDKDSLA